MSADPELLREAGGETWAWLKKAPWLWPVPSLLFAAGTALDVTVAPLHSGLTALTALLKGLGWGLYLWLALRACGGVAHSSPVVPLVTMVLAFLGLEYGGVGVVVLVLAWLLPVSDYAVMYAEGPDGALGGVLDTAREHALVWFGTLLALFVALVMIGLVLALPMSLFSTYASRESPWLADLSGGVLVGPLVHAAVVFRGRLFLALHGDPA